MYAFDFSINNMTLLALTLSVGFVVDDAIVMLENIVRHIEGGMRPFEAALKGSARNRLHHHFDHLRADRRVHSGADDGRHGRPRVPRIRGHHRGGDHPASGFVSLTLTPMLCARVLKAHHGDENQNIVLRLFEAMFRSWLRGYEVSLDLCLKYKSVVILAMFATLVGTVWLYMIIPKGFFPTEDTGFISAHGGRALRHLLQGDVCPPAGGRGAIVRKDPAVDYVNSTVGTGGPNPTNNNGRLFIALKPRHERAERLDGRSSSACAPRRTR